MNKPERELDLREIFLYLWRHAAILVLCMAAGAAVMAGLALCKANSVPACQATALLTFDLRAADQGTAASTPFGYYSNIANMANVIAQSDAVLSPAAESLSLPVSDLKGRITVSAVSNSSFLQLCVTGSDEEQTRQICGAVAAALPQASAEMTNLGTLRVISEVTVSAVAGASPARSALIGALIGVLLGVVVLAGIELFDHRLRDAGDVTGVLGLKVLAVIPADGSKSARLQPEARRALCTALRPVLAKEAHPLLVAVGTAGGPCCADAEHLARALARGGKTVLLADADRESAGESCGLSDLLQRRVSVQELPVSTEEAGLFRLSFGHPAESLADLLDAPEAAPLLDALRQRYDYVVLSVPYASLTDGAALSRFAAGTVLLVRAGKTLLESALLAGKTLAEGPAPVLGAVLTGYAWEKAPRRDGYYYALSREAR